MHYLIDGHNLIAQTPDIDLADEYDEAQLVLKLKSWTAANAKRRVTVIFDGGLPGGKVKLLSNRQLNVIFASVGQTADSLLIKRIYKAKDPRAYTIVSNDQAILDAAKTRRMPVMRADAFVRRHWPHHKPAPPQPQTPDKAETPTISETEVAEWLDLFGPVPERKSPQKAKKPKPAKPAAATDTNKQHKPLKTDKQAEQKLSQAEIDEWLSLFGGNE